MDELTTDTFSLFDVENDTFQEEDVTSDFIIIDELFNNGSSYETTSESYLKQLQNYSIHEPISAILDIINHTLLSEDTTQPVTSLPDSYHHSKHNAFTEYLPNFEDVLHNDSNIFSNTSIEDSFRNYTLNSSIENSSYFSSDIFATGETFFNFNITTWLTLIPQDIQDQDDAISHDGKINTSFIIFKVVILAFISLVGSLGNVMVIWSVVKESHLHRPPFYFMLSLGVTDLSRAVFCLPVVITTVLHGSRWRHGESACKLFAFATSFFVFSSALSLLAIAIDRHVSIVYSKTYRRRSLGIANLVVAIIIWVIAFSVSFPPVVGVGDYVFIPDEAQCAYQHKHYTYNDSVSSVLVFIAILFLTYFLYFRIFRYLRAHRRMRPLQHAPALSSNWAFVGPGANGQAFINWLNGFGVKPQSDKEDRELFKDSTLVVLLIYPQLKMNI